MINAPTEADRKAQVLRFLRIMCDNRGSINMP
jgi:hypothetical protein